MFGWDPNADFFTGGFIGWMILAGGFMLVCGAVQTVYRLFTGYYHKEQHEPVIAPYRDTTIAPPIANQREDEYLAEEARERERIIARMEARHAENMIGWPDPDPPPLDLESLEGIISSAVAAHMREIRHTDSA